MPIGVRSGTRALVTKSNGVCRSILGARVEFDIEVGFGRIDIATTK